MPHPHEKYSKVKEIGKEKKKKIRRSDWEIQYSIVIPENRTINKELKKISKYYRTNLQHKVQK